MWLWEGLCLEVLVIWIDVVVVFGVLVIDEVMVEFCGCEIIEV